VIYRRALGIFEKTYGPEHYEVAANLHGLGSGTGRARCLPRGRGVLPANSPDAALTRHNLGKRLTPGHPHLALARENLQNVIRSFEG
jgi:hypothetical protein